MNWPDRSRLGWWAFVLALAAATLYVTWSFVGMLVLGLFGYYATRPICKRIERVIDSDWIAAALTVLAVLIPLLLLVVYTGIQGIHQIHQSFGGSAVSELAAAVVGLDAIPFEQRQQLITAIRNPLSVDTGALQGSLWSTVQRGSSSSRRSSERWSWSRCP